MKTRTQKLTIAITAIIIMVLGFAPISKAQNNKLKSSLSVLNIDTKGIGMDPIQMGNLVRIELEKQDTFQVMDRYDVAYVIEKNKLSIGNCYGKLCLVEVGEIIKSDYMFTGSAELYGETIIITFRLIDVKSQTIVKTQVNEYLNLPRELQTMVRITLNSMLGKKSDETIVQTLTKKNNYDNSINNKNKTKVDLSGPRSGFTVFTGNAAKYMESPKERGGYNSYPVMFQFGYQFEKQYLNEGNYQALFEFLPTITGFNQNVFIPSFTILNGIRNNKHGWEFAFGPTFGIVRKADGYYDGGNNWQLASNWIDTLPNPFPIIERIDSRGTPELNSSFILAFGKTFKSGKLNIPVNFYVVPNKEGWRFGASFGFNAKKW
jgi:TolB-like protein